MRWFLDTEFHEDGKTIDLISIALVSEHGKQYYAVSSEFDVGRCSPWLHQHVLPKLPPREQWKPRHQIAEEIRLLVIGAGPPFKPKQRPEFWAYYGDYDWVALCQLYGTMMRLPPGMPHLCLDFMQAIMHAGISKDDLPKQDPETEHDALGDALWLRRAFEWCHNQQLGFTRSPGKASK